MQRIEITIVLLVLTASAAATQAAAQPPAGSALDLQGHRGARGLYPENSLEGFRDTLALGVTTLELDAGMTRDGVVVVHHDVRLGPDVARGADDRWIDSPTPALRSLSWAELQAYDVGRYRPGSAYAQRFPEVHGRDGVRVPRLQAVLAEAERLCRGGIRFNIETKVTPVAPDLSPEPVELTDAVVRVVRESGAASRCTIQSFDFRTLRHIRASAPELKTACLTREDSGYDTIRRDQPGPSPWTAGLDVDAHGGSVPRLVAAVGCRVWSPRFQDLDSAEVALAHELGLEVVPWTVNETTDIEAVLDLLVDGIISDRPDRVRSVLQARGAPLPAACPVSGD